MAKLREVIAAADAMRPNAIDEEQKARWLYACDADIAETMRCPMPPFVWPLEGEDAELLMPYPHDDCYLPYLCAKIDDYNQDTDLYANDRATATAALSDARAWWRRHHMPWPSRYWRLSP